ncbi:hypothetical protein M0R45_016358 [Rubus argutus]|uniref:Uncharacterized protein n=1 Tax=Rubus argutus TaxID=59490 RepID=A0AAW1XSV3_RUBAR
MLFPDPRRHAIALIGIAAEIETRVFGDDDGAREDRIRAWICSGTDECGGVSWVIGSGFFTEERSSGPSSANNGVA